MSGTAIDIIKPKGVKPRRGIQRLHRLPVSEPVSFTDLPDPTPLTEPVKEFDFYAASRRRHLEERLIKTRGKLKLLIAEAREFGMEHLLIEGE